MNNNIATAGSDLLQLGETKTKHVFSLSLPIGGTSNCTCTENLVAIGWLS